MAKLKIRWTETAVVEFSRMLTFYDVRNGNTQYSRSIVKMVRDSLRLVVKFPKMFRAVDMKELPDVRAFHCDYFLIYYKIKDKYIEVEAVVDTRQEPRNNPEESFA